MSTTIRINIASSGPINDLVDDVLTTQFAWHDVFALEPDIPVSIDWPTGADNGAYLRFPQGAAEYIAHVKGSVEVPGYAFIVPVGVAFQPIVVPKPANDLLVLLSSISARVDILYF
jgi:hypothetical protein